MFELHLFSVAYRIQGTTVTGCHGKPEPPIKRSCDPGLRLSKLNTILLWRATENTRG
jgi:hypothetical protein